jgi:TM2 domain-containing membrane protein YozV
MVAISTRKLVLAIILDMVIAGSGHIFVRYVKRGIIILISAISIGIIISLFSPSDFSLLVAIVFWLWMIYDLMQIVKRENKKSFRKDEILQSNSKLQNHCIKCGNYNPAGSAFCNKCGFALR